MSEPNELVRQMSADEAASLGPLPDPDVVSPTVDRDRSGPETTAEVHLAGVVPSPPYEASADDDPLAPPPSLTEED